MTSTSNQAPTAIDLEVRPTEHPDPTPVTNLRETRKAMAASKRAHPAGKAAPKKAAVKKAPAKAAAKKAAGPAPDKTAYVATGRGGKVNTRMFTTPMKFAVDVADEDGRTPAAKAGLIFGFYPTRELAEKAAERTNAKAGLHAIVTTAKAVKA